jgi:hypothetical protein
MQAVMLDEDGPEGIYVSMNPCNRALLGRADNRLIANVTRTTDADSPILRHQLIDIDPLRPSGTSSTDDDHLMALKYTEVIRQRLAEEGWPEPLLGDSGNGGHLILALPDLPNTTENVELIKNVLLALEKRYTNHIQTSGGKSKACFMLRDVSLSIDQSILNPSRLMKLYGTHARKGITPQSGRIDWRVSCPFQRRHVLFHSKCFRHSRQR